MAEENEKEVLRKKVIERIKKQALELGAVNAQVIDAGTVVVAPWVTMKCKYGCSGYNKSYCCPPRTPSYAETHELLSCYRRAILIHCKSYKIPTKIVVELERELFLSGFHKAFGLGCGPCRICKECNLEKCNFPKKTRPAMEACGIDVFATARANGFFIEVLKDPTCEENCFGLLLVE